MAPLAPFFHPRLGPGEQSIRIELLTTFEADQPGFGFGLFSELETSLNNVQMSETLKTWTYFFGFVKRNSSSEPFPVDSDYFKVRSRRDIRSFLFNGSLLTGSFPDANIVIVFSLGSLKHYSHVHSQTLKARTIKNAQVSWWSLALMASLSSSLECVSLVKLASICASKICGQPTSSFFQCYGRHFVLTFQKCGLNKQSKPWNFICLQQISP